MSKRVKKGIDDLETLYPELAKEWHPTLNGTLLPSDVLPGSNRKVYWKCLKCNYVWKAEICNRAKLKRGCPCCANKVTVKGVNDLATTHPEIAKEWYQPLNGDITPSMLHMVVERSLVGNAQEVTYIQQQYSQDKWCGN